MPDDTIADYEEIPRKCERCGDIDTHSSVLELTRFGGLESMWVICRKCSNYVEFTLRGAKGK